ncbi:MAG: cysteine desulfurase [Oligoflexales bacterium]|nr:cysteine desulfurase [Oligoflexales bacterium]
MKTESVRKVYADCNATTPSTQGHCEEVCKLVQSVYGNPSSIHHDGREAKLLMEEARELVASFFSAERREIFFTSGATEANNLAIQGACSYHAQRRRIQQPNLVLSQIEHSSVLTLAETLEERGLCELRFVNVNSQGLFDREGLLSAVDENTVLISLILVNNEIGVLNPIQPLVDPLKAKNPHAHIHMDAVQAYGKIDLTWLGSSKVDSAAISGHKIGAFKGIGALYKKKDSPLHPLIIGGGQERGLRSGTENFPGIISLSLKTKELSKKQNWIEHLFPIRDRLLDGLLKWKGVRIHGDPELCLPSTLNFYVEGVEGSRLMLLFDRARIAVSGGSACAAGGGKPSSVLKALGCSEEEAANSVRLSFGEGSSLEDADRILEVLRTFLL